MNKTELIQEVAEQSGEAKVTVETVLNTFFSVVPEFLEKNRDKDEKIQITGFGTFRTSLTEERVGRNPKNPKEVLVIPASYRTYFSAGKNFKEIVNGKKSAKKVSAKKVEKVATKKTKTVVTKTVKKKK